MNSNSIESQQNGNTEPENSKIAQIYQRMLLGQKSALASLQKIKTPSPKQLIHSRQHHVTDQQSPQFTRKKNMNRTQIQHRIKTINEEPLEESMFRQKQKDKRQEKLRTYIKKKVNELRTQKQVLRNLQERQIDQIKKVADTRKTHTVNQSKSYDLVKRKQFVHKTANQTGSGMSAVKEQVKKAFQSISIQQGMGMSKVQSSSKPSYNKHLPPLKQRKKIPTQNSQQNQDLAQSKIIPRKDIRTPINLADSSLKVQLKSAESHEVKTKNSASKSAKQGGNKKQESRVKKISLPEMRRMREEFAVINQKEKSAQLEMMQCHMKTKQFVQGVKARNGLNFRNYQRLNEMKKCLNPQPVSTTLKTIPSSMKSQHPQEPKKKKFFAIQQQKIDQAFDEIKLIEEVIAKKRAQATKIENKLSTNLLVQFWNSYDLQQHDFGQDDEDLPQIQICHAQNMSQSKITQAYSTAMPQSKDKKWQRKAIKQYDTNRSFQEYAKSRSQFKPSRVNEEKNSLNRIDENEQDQQEDNGINKVTVNSRLRKLLLQ